MVVYSPNTLFSWAPGRRRPSLDFSDNMSVEDACGECGVRVAAEVRLASPFVGEWVSTSDDVMGESVRGVWGGDEEEADTGERERKRDLERESDETERDDELEETAVPARSLEREAPPNEWALDRAQS